MSRPILTIVEACYEHLLLKDVNEDLWLIERDTKWTKRFNITKRDPYFQDAFVAKLVPERKLLDVLMLSGIVGSAL